MTPADRTDDGASTEIQFRLGSFRLECPAIGFQPFSSKGKLCERLFRDKESPLGGQHLAASDTDLLLGFDVLLEEGSRSLQINFGELDIFLFNGKARIQPLLFDVQGVELCVDFFDAVPSGFFLIVRNHSDRATSMSRRL
jgi:hypothetical protein